MNILLKSVPSRSVENLQRRGSAMKSKSEKTDSMAEDKIEIDGERIRQVRLSVQPHLGRYIDIYA